MLKMKTIRHKLILFFLLISIIPLLILGGYNIISTSKNLEKAATNNLRDKSAEKVDLIRTRLRKVENDLRFLSTSFAINNLMEAYVFDDPDEINYWSDATANMYLSFSQNNDHYKKIRYINENGQEIIRVDCDSTKSWIVDENERRNESDQLFFTNAMKLPQGEIHSSNLELELEKGAVKKPYIPLMHYATPVFDEDGATRGLVVLDLYAASFLRPFKATNSGRAILARTDGYFLAHPDTALEWGFQLGKTESTIKNEVRADLFERMAAADNGIADTGNGKIFSFSPVYYQPSDSSRYWIALVEESEDVIYAAVDSFINSLLFIIFAIGLVVFFLSSLISKSFSQPISETVEVITQIANGNLHQPKLKNTSHDEIGQLARACNKMLDGLGQLVRKAEAIADGKLGAVALEKAIKDGKSIQIAAAEQAGNEMHGLQGDLAEAFLKMLQQLKILTVQARFIASDELHHPALQHQQKGELGEAFNEMVQNLGVMAQRASDIADGKLKESSAQDQAGLHVDGVLGSAFVKMHHQLTELVYRAEAIAPGKLGSEDAE
ncbi:MAG: HAMP domain-containing protein, partial [Calditrichaeota bacterium]